jgi:hypothetical protein
MAQATIDRFKREKPLLKHASTDTNDKNISISISNSKSVQVYYSKSYKEYIVSFNIGSKKFIFTRRKWLYFRTFLELIDETIINQ